MTPKTTIQLTLTALVAGAIAAPAFGAGEPKRELPFIRPAAAPSTALRVVSGVTTIVPTGEAKNEAPFTAPYSDDPGYRRALREAAAGGPFRSLQFVVLGVGGASVVPLRGVAAVKIAKADKGSGPANRFQVGRDAV
jgi:hypothetical protein